MNIKHLLSIAFVAICAMNSSASAFENLLRLHYTDGSVADISLFDNPVITFSDIEINVRTTAMTIGVNYNDICNFSYVISGEAGLKSVEVDKNVINLSGCELIYDFGPRGGVIAVYDLQGRVIKTHSFASGVGSLSIVGLASGTYIACANSSSFKFRVNE